MRCVKVTRHCKFKNSKPVKDIAGRNVFIEEDQIVGFYFQPIDEMAAAIDGELYRLQEFSVGYKITFEVVEMTKEKYESLPEFQGY